MPLVWIPPWLKIHVSDTSPPLHYPRFCAERKHQPSFTHQKFSQMMMEKSQSQPMGAKTWQPTCRKQLQSKQVRKPC